MFQKIPVPSSIQPKTVDMCQVFSGASEKDFGSVSLEAVMDTVSRVYLGITLLGISFAILEGIANSVRQIIDGLFTFIKGALGFIPGMGQTYFT